MSALLKRDPCDCCPELRSERGTGFCYCGASAHGDPECAGYLLAVTVGILAAEVAALIAALENEVMRREIAEGACDGIANALFTQGLGAQLDDGAFLALCGCPRKAAA